MRRAGLRLGARDPRGVGHEFGKLAAGRDVDAHDIRASDDEDGHLVARLVDMRRAHGHAHERHGRVAEDVEEVEPGRLVRLDPRERGGDQRLRGGADLDRAARVDQRLRLQVEVDRTARDVLGDVRRRCLVQRHRGDERDEDAASEAGRVAADGPLHDRRGQWSSLAIEPAHAEEAKDGALDPHRRGAARLLAEGRRELLREPADAFQAGVGSVVHARMLRGRARPPASRAPDPVAPRRRGRRQGRAQAASDARRIPARNAR